MEPVEVYLPHSPRPRIADGAIGGQLHESDIEVLAPEAKIQNIFGGDKEVKPGL